MLLCGEGAMAVRFRQHCLAGAQRSVIAQLLLDSGAKTEIACDSDLKQLSIESSYE